MVCVDKFGRSPKWMLLVIVSAMFLLTCTVVATPAPTAVVNVAPTKESESQKYLRDAKGFSLTHSETIAVLTAEIQRLAVESKDPKLRVSSDSLMTLNPHGMTPEQIIDALRKANSVSPEGLELLKSHQATLFDLFLRVKRDQLALLRILPPAGVTGAFHEMAFATLDQETTSLVSLMNVYSSPGLLVTGRELGGLPAKIAQTQAEVARAVELWKRTITQLNATSP